jgi:hypothetical protein
MKKEKDIKALKFRERREKKGIIFVWSHVSHPSRGWLRHSPLLLTTTNGPIVLMTDEYGTMMEIQLTEKNRS